MHNNIQRLVTLFALVALASVAGCKPGADNPVATADSSMAAEPAGATGEMSGSAQVAITNPMPHDMMVSADWGNGANELGTVKANESKTFDIAAPAGTQVKLVATDEGKTHSPNGSVTLQSGAPAAWTIQ